MLIVHATGKLLHRVGPVTGHDLGQSTTLLGDWYATALFWKPQVTLLVNETTLLPVLMPLAPAATWSARIGEQIATVLSAHGTPPQIVEHERDQMRTCRLARTANRSVVGIMTEFGHLAAVYRNTRPQAGLLDLALRLAATPCSPLYRSHISPDRELHALVQSLTG